MFINPWHERPAEGLQPASAEPLDGIAREHAVLVRRMAKLQTQVSALVRSHERQLQFWQQRLMRQSARLMLERTRADWGLWPKVVQLSKDLPSDPAVAMAVAEAGADAVICRTGCVMDDHHWRQGTHCRLHGRVCLTDESVELEFKKK